MDVDTVIRIGGGFHFAFLIFHALFWKLFGWKSELPKMGRVNGAITQVLNLCLMFCFLLFGYISLFYTSELRSPGLGRVLLVFIALFWLVRAAEQIVFFSMKKPISVVLFILFLLGFCLYAYPLARI